jgi:hypothetical protein
MVDVVHLLTETRHLVIHPLARTVLIAERPVLGHAVPGIESEIARKGELRRDIENLLANAQCGDGKTRGQALRPQNRIVLKRH